MTRRKFLQKLVNTGAVFIVGGSWLIKKVSPYKFIWAVKLKKYPGMMKSLPNIYKQSKWSG